MQLVSRAEARRNQLKSYFTGRPCIHGHIAPRTTATGRCRTCSNNQQFHFSHTNDEIILLRSAKYRAKRKGVPFSITVDDIVIPPSCPCCDVVLVPKSMRTHHMKTGLPDSPSIDRKNPALGYVPGNVAILCMRCNTLKSGITKEMIEFLIDYLG